MVFVMFFLSSCSQLPPSIDTFKGRTPNVDVKEYFAGEINAWGFIQDWSGKVSRRFTVKMVGTWKGDVGTLEEDFVYDDGEKQKRIWTLTKTGHNTFIGEASDVIGKAKGAQEGNALNMKYTLRVPFKGKSIDIKINDWLILLDEKRLMNISVLSKFGINLGRLTIFFEKK